MIEGQSHIFLYRQQVNMGLFIFGKLRVNFNYVYQKHWIDRKYQIYKISNV